MEIFRLSLALPRPYPRYFLLKSQFSTNGIASHTLIAQYVICVLMRLVTALDLNIHLKISYDVSMVKRSLKIDTCQKQSRNSQKKCRVILETINLISKLWI